LGRNDKLIGSRFSPAAGKITSDLNEKGTNSSPRSSQRTLRKKIVNNLCDLCVLCGEIFIEFLFKEEKHI